MGGGMAYDGMPFPGTGWPVANLVVITEYAMIHTL